MDEAEPQPMRDAVRQATHRLAEAGVASAPVDALVLAAHALGVEVSEARRLLVVGGVDVPQRYAELVAERARRVPLQHLTGVAPFRRLALSVGPGVFVPRPETEVVVELALGVLADRRDPIVVDLASGSGAIAFAVKSECPRASVYAVELSPHAHAWARANRDRLGLAVALALGDGRTAYESLVGRVDVVTCNPPYIPPGAEPRDPEVRDHDPALALYGGGEDGLGLALELAARAATLLRPGGRLVMEHADVQGAAVLRAFRDAEPWESASDHADLTGRPRVVVAVRGLRRPPGTPTLGA
ncbi:MAG: peptide chain release factor N(5)-glutamine methyltransferase [Dermatophilaceae bacterium]